MAQFQYRATDFQGKIVEGSMEAGEERSVVQRLREKGLIPIRIGVGTTAAPRAAGKAITLPSFGRKGVKTAELLIFTRELATLLQAGMPLDRSLTTLTQLAQTPELKRVTSEVLESVRGGTALAEALGQHPKVFPPLYVNMVKAGEVGGVLDQVLQRLVEYLQSAEELRDEVISALTYPLILVGVGGVSVAILLIFVLPKFATMFADLGQALPLSTRMMLAISDAATSPWSLIGVPAVCAALFGLYRYFSTTKRMAFDAFKLRMPVVGNLLRLTEVARFGRTLGVLLRSGVPMLQALDIVRAVATNQVIAQALNEVQVGVREGAGMAAPLGRSGVFPQLALQMIAVGEDTGKLDEMLVTTADFFDREVRNDVKRLTRLLEPAMILIMGLVVGFMVISMLMAVFSINDVDI
ncbi:MAG: type II secretion system F family protein [Deltaproteobacteria bacterium]|nr:type II secretion system F family protein [Deltaproteobacteria bacterium]